MRGNRNLLIGAVIMAVAAAACASDDSGGGFSADGSESASEGGFVGLAADEAIALADEEGRPWRIARQDDEVFAFDGELLVGRVTFEVDDGVVTGFSEEVDVPPPLAEPPSEDVARAGVVVAAISRVLTVDNTFGGRDVFDDIRVATTIGGNANTPLQPIELELIAAALEASATVTFVSDADDLAQELFEASSNGEAVATGVAIVSIDAIRMESDRAEVELHMWCGTLCGTFLTYEAVSGADGWHITGPIGPIAVS